MLFLVFDESDADWPSKYMQWVLFATQAATSVPHHDAGKYGTWLRILHGVKLWIICHQKATFEDWVKAVEDGTLDRYDWTPIVLRAGHEL
jgi:hypothetical protein